jgi:hypothetical protein
VLPFAPTGCRQGIDQPEGDELNQSKSQWGR